jgi:hypothetical protein
MLARTVAEQPKINPIVSPAGDEMFLRGPLLLVAARYFLSRIECELSPSIARISDE